MRARLFWFCKFKVVCETQRTSLSLSLSPSPSASLSLPLPSSSSSVSSHALPHAAAALLQSDLSRKKNLCAAQLPLSVFLLPGAGGSSDPFSYFDTFPRVPLVGLGHSEMETDR